MPKTALFNRHSHAYDEWFERNADLYEAELEAVRTLLPPQGTKGLEVGVGSGKFAAPLGIETGVEPSEAMAARARTKGITVVPAVAEALPFSAGRFSAVLMVTTICFVDDIVKSFKEAYRVLRPGGCIIVGFVDRESDLGKAYEAKREESRFYRDATFFSAQEVRRHLQTAGFEIDRIRQTLIPEETPGTVLEGFGQGAFVVVKGLAVRQGA